MTEEQFLQYVENMLPELNQLIMEKARKVVYDKIVDLDEWEDNYLLPKIFLSAMGQEIGWQYKPHDRDHWKKRDKIARSL